MLVKSLTKISFVGLGNVFNAGLGFLFVAAVARNISVEDFGKYALLTTILVSTAKITDFGTNSLFVAHSITKSQNMINKFFTLKLYLFTFAFPISLAILYFLNLADFELLVIFILGFIGYSLNFALFGLFQKIERYNMLIALNTIPASIKGIFALFMFGGLVELNLQQAFIIFACGILPSAFLYFYLPPELKKFKIDRKDLKEYFLQTFPAGTSQLMGEGWSAISNSIAKIAKDFSNVGVFYLADKISSAFSLVSLSIFTVLLPKNAVRKREHQGYDFLETGILSVGILFLSGIAIILAKIIIPMFFGAEYAGSAAIIDFTILANAFMAIHTFMENYFYIEGKTGALMYISIIRLATLLLLSFILIPILSLSGLALAQLSAAFVASLTTLTFMLAYSKKGKPQLMSNQL